MNIWGRKQQNREEKLQFWATNPEIAEIFHSSANFFFGSGAVSFPKPQKAVLFPPPGGANPAGILTGEWKAENEGNFCFEGRDMGEHGL